ncbi:hypothetical protein GLYMA_19G046733v4 [Glycine max]|nr:hypothetical protein GLYMA_19G046733v4 [Glycine max]KAH1076413.1 hypothetical protein GYH30_052064 [Glycine max]
MWCLWCSILLFWSTLGILTSEFSDFRNFWDVMCFVT